MSSLHTTHRTGLRVRATTQGPFETDADTIAVGVFEGEGVAHDVEGGVLQALVDAGEARPTFRKLAVAHAKGRRFVLVGLGEREAFDAERARVAAATVSTRARELSARVLCWQLPLHVDGAHAAALVEGTVLATYEDRRFKSADDDEDVRALEELIVSAHHDLETVVEQAGVVAAAVNAARDLQNAPANVLTPTALAERARELAGEVGLQVDVMGRAEIEAAGMGAFAAVARGSEEEPQLITLRYEPQRARGPVLGFVGKAVTFDSGGISIKPAAKMHEMKCDMSGGAAVLEAVGAIARLELPVRVIAVLGASENLLSGQSMKPGDVLRAGNGTTIEVLNTDAEGRLVLADCLHHAVEQGAERLVDVATLTGAIVTALGVTHAGLVSDDDEWAEQVRAAGARAGELLWRLPLHPEYADSIKSPCADIANSVENREAGAIAAAEFLRNFTAGVPWAHLDIAGTAWANRKAYTPEAGSGYGVRTLVELARAAAA